MKQNVFCDEELTYMKTQIQNMIEQNLCPLENPIRIERVQYEQLDDAIAEATIIHVSQPNTPESHLGAQPENTPPRTPAQQPRAVSPHLQPQSELQRTSSRRALEILKCLFPPLQHFHLLLQPQSHQLLYPLQIHPPVLGHLSSLMTLIELWMTMTYYS